VSRRSGKQNGKRPGQQPFPKKAAGLRRGDSCIFSQQRNVGRATVLVDGVNIGEKTAAYIVDPLPVTSNVCGQQRDGGYEHARWLPPVLPQKSPTGTLTEIIAGGTAYRYEAHNIAPVFRGDYVILTKNHVRRMHGHCQDVEPVIRIINAYSPESTMNIASRDTWYAAGQPLPGSRWGIPRGCLRSTA
jgi:hypothetical protein